MTTTEKKTQISANWANYSSHTRKKMKIGNYELTENEFYGKKKIVGD